MKFVSAQDPGSGTFNVKAYGAKGDGSTDDTSAFNACFSAASTYAGSNGGARVLVPPASYKINGPVTVKANITYDFRGAYIFNGNTFTSANWHMFNYTAASSYGGASNVTVLGGVFDAKGQNAPTDTTSTTQYAKNVFLIGDGRNYRFDGCTFRNIPSFHALDVNGIDGLTVTNCRFEGFVDNNSPSTRSMSEAIQLEMGTGGGLTKNVRITNCYCGPAIDGSGLGGFGKFTGAHTDTNGSYYANVTVSNNTIESPLQNGIGFWSITDSVITGNVITGAAKDGIRLTAGNSSSTNQNFNVTVSNNTIRGSGQAGISLEACRRCVVSGNYIYDSGLGGIDLSAPYTNYPTANSTNTQPSPDNTITGNTIIGASRTTNNAFGAINITGANNTKNYIANNSFRKYGSGNEALTPIRIEGTGAGNNYIVNNTFGQDWSTDYLSNITTSNAVWWDNGKPRYVPPLSSDFQGPTGSPSAGVTLTNVTGMSFPVDSNCTYEVEMYLALTVFDPSGTSTNDCDVKTNWSVPSGTTGTKFTFGSVNNNLTIQNSTTNIYIGRSQTMMQLVATSPGSNVNYQVRSVGNVSNRDPQLTVERGIITTTNSGTVQLQVCQVTAQNTVVPVIGVGSYIKYRKLDV